MSNISGRTEKFLSDFPKYIPIGTATVYIVGFVVLNSYLGAFGMSDYSALNPRLLAAGFLFFLYVLCFYLFVGRRIVIGRFKLERLLAPDGEWNQKNSEVWRMWAILDYGVECLFSLCFSTSAFYAISTLSRPSTEFVVSATIVIVYRLVLPFVNTYVGRGFGVTTEFFAMIGACFSFLKSIPSSDGSIYAFNIYMIGAILFGVIIRNKRFITGVDERFFVGLYGFLLLTGSAIGFGAKVYPSISARLGGGMPTNATILIDEKQQSNAAKLGIATNPYQASILYQNSDFVLIHSQDGTFQIRRDWIQAIRTN